MQVSSVIRERLAKLRVGQKDLAAAAEVTESYISQLLTRRKLPPAPDRTDIYEKMETFLGLPAGRLSELARLERIEELKRNLGDVPKPLNEGVREFVLRKCSPSTRESMGTIFARDAFGPVERLVVQRLLSVAKTQAKEDLRGEEGSHLLSKPAPLSFPEARVAILEFLDTDVLALSAEQCATFLDPFIESWNFDLRSFEMGIVLSPRLGPVRSLRLRFVQTESDLYPEDEEPGFADFVADSSLSGDASGEEVAFLKSLSFRGRRPTALYYYRELQNLRDPLHFADGGPDG